MGSDKEKKVSELGYDPKADPKCINCSSLTIAECGNFSACKFIDEKCTGKLVTDYNENSEGC